MTEKHIINMLDECLEAVLVRGEDIDAVCSRFPGFEEELRQMAGIALQSRGALAVDVPGEVVDSSKARVMEGVRQIAARRGLENSVVGGASGRRRFGLRSLAWITAAFVLLTSGTALAASGAGPDSLLYPIKQRLEEARTVMAWQSLDKARAEVEHAGSRLDEIAEMKEAGRNDLVPDLVYRYDLHLRAALAYANEAAADGEDADEVYAMIDTLKDRFDKIMAEKDEGFSGNAGGDLKGDRSGGDGSAGGVPGGAEDSRGDGNYDHGDDSTSDGYDNDNSYPGDGGDDYEEGGGYPDSGSGGDHAESGETRSRDSEEEPQH